MKRKRRKMFYFCTKSMNNRIYELLFEDVWVIVGNATNDLFDVK